MSGNETDMSDSNLESPFSQSDSPFSSPSQQVPQLANFISELSCEDKMKRANRPHLRIIEQPQNHFRFRYKSEMIGTHGCLLGQSNLSSKSKTHPTVELRNYTGKALIKCKLVRHDNTEEHPHRLLEDDQDREVSSVVPENGNYRVTFTGMGIIHTAKKDVTALLFQKYAQNGNNLRCHESRVRLMCENEAKGINLNIVRLKFSAHDLKSDEEICPPVYSEPIHNMKSAATNDLKICRISRCYGRPQGGDDVFILVEKVNKKNIMIRFFELDENGERGWSSTGSFLHSDVHHQYAIVFRTPQYIDPQITKDVKVYIELVRPSDGRTSEPKEFTYKAETIYKQIHNKKRKANSSYSSLESCSGSSIKSYSELPATIELVNKNNFNHIDDDVMGDIPVYPIKVPEPLQVAPTSDSMMADAILYDMGSVSQIDTQRAVLSPMLSQPNVPPPPVLQLNSSEMDRIIQRSIEPEERKRFMETDLTEYFKQFDGSIPELGDSATMEMLKYSMFVSDSGRAKPNVNYWDKDFKTATIKEEYPKLSTKKLNPGEYAAFYKSEDGEEVKELVKELCEMIRNKTGYKKQVVRNKLERLFEMRLSNGDAFLHMTLSSNQPSLEYIVKLIHSMRMTKLLNLKNNRMQTILHLAVINDSAKLVSFLVSKGCNPMEEDREGNNAIHYAVICQTCIGPLLDAIKSNEVSCNLNACNNEKQSPLHLAVIYGSVESADHLLRHGASLNTRDDCGRTPLHLAAYDDCRPVARLLLERVLPSEVDVVDGRGYTALQIVCDGRMRTNTLEIATLLLQKKADPTKHDDYGQPAWKLARDKPELLELIQKYMDPKVIMEDDIKSEPEDDFESADEGEPQDTNLSELPKYRDDVCVLLDENGAWRELARRLHKESLMSWYGATPSPTKTLLNHIKECDDCITSKSLALLLEDIGCPEAAIIVRQYLTD